MSRPRKPVRKLATAVMVAGATAVSLPAASARAGEVRFTNVTAASGINHVQWSSPPPASTYPLLDIPFESGGVAAGDYDRDGWTDLLVTRLDATPILYRNQRNGTFADVTPASLKLTSDGAAVPTNGAAWGDVNNDGHLDVYVQSTLHTRHYLFMGDGKGNFAEQAAARGVAHDYGTTRYGMSPALGDYDRDGYLDLLTSEWSYDTTGTRGTRLHRNLGPANPGHFQDVTAAAGVAPPGMRAPHSFAPRFTDLDRDGYADIAVTSDYGTSQVLWNNKNGTFKDGTVEAGVNTGNSEMGSTIADYDGDGRPDWFVAALVGNRLYKNMGDRTFVDVSAQAGVREGAWGWGAAFVDYDNDGRRDIMHTNGMLNYSSFKEDQTRLWRNLGNGQFADVANAVGVTDTGAGKGLITFDFDNDGDLDVFIANNGAAPVLYRNDGGNANAWLKVRPVGGAGTGVAGANTNRDGYGVWITVRDALLPYDLVWEVDGGSNYLGQSDPTAFFGLGPDFTGTIDLVQIQWPGGLLQEYRNVAPNQLLEPLEVNAVPEPTTAAALAMTAAGLLCRRRTRRTPPVA